jgi:hypothetical protein
MKILLTLIVFIINPAYSQVSDYIYKLGINDKNELVRVISDSPYKFEKIDSSSRKEKFILKLLSEKIDSKNKNKAQIICTGIGTRSDSVYNLSESRVCKDIKSNELIYSSYDFSIKDGIAELELVDQILSQAEDNSKSDKNVDNTSRRKSKGTTLLEMFEKKVRASQTVEK